MNNFFNFWQEEGAGQICCEFPFCHRICIGFCTYAGYCDLLTFVPAPQLWGVANHSLELLVDHRQNLVVTPW